MGKLGLGVAYIPMTDQGRNKKNTMTISSFSDAPFASVRPLKLLPGF